MKLSILTLVALSMETSTVFAATSTSIRRELTIVDQEPSSNNNNSNHHVILPDMTSHPVDELRTRVVKTDEFHRYMRYYAYPLICPSTSFTDSHGNEMTDCVVYGCNCEGDYSVQENVDPQGIGCNHCSKPDGKPCVKDNECLVFSSMCINGVCAPAICPNTAVETATLISRDCVSKNCGCTGEYSVKEDVIGNGCYHCSKPNDASCVKSSECATTSTCQNGKCTAKSQTTASGQCPSTTQVISGGNLAQLCTRTSTCACSGEYNVKEEIIAGCYHCSKQDGASCTSDFDCLHGKSKCYDNVCGPIRNTNFCPLLQDGKCTLDSTCTCGNPSFPNLVVYNLKNTKCYTCKA